VAVAVACCLAGGMALGMFALNYAFYFVFIWLPTYVVKAGGFSLSDMASIVAAIYGTYSVVTVLTGRLADRQISRGSSATRVWKSIVAVSAMGQVLSIASCAFVEPQLAVWLLGLAGIFFGMGAPALYTLAATLPGPRAGGRWAGAQAVGGQLAGIVSPVVTGVLTDSTGTDGGVAKAA
jgi:MFS family permease